MHYRYPANRSQYYLETNQPTLTTDDIHAEGRIVAGTHHELDDDVCGYLKTLPETKVGVAMRSSQLTKYQCRQQLRNPRNYPAALPDTLYDKRGAEIVTYNSVMDHVRGEWFDALPRGQRRGGTVEIGRQWLSEEEVVEITGLNFAALQTLSVAPVNLIYTVAEKDLIESDRDVHLLGEGSIKLDTEYDNANSSARFYPANG